MRIDSGPATSSQGVGREGERGGAGDDGVTEVSVILYSFLERESHS